MVESLVEQKLNHGLNIKSDVRVQHAGVFIQLDLNGVSFSFFWCCHVYIYIYIGEIIQLNYICNCSMSYFFSRLQRCFVFFNQGWFTSGNGPRISKEIIIWRDHGHFWVYVRNIRGFNVWTFDLWVSRYILDKIYKNTKVLDFQKGTYTKIYLDLRWRKSQVFPFRPLVRHWVLKLLTFLWQKIRTFLWSLKKEEPAALLAPPRFALLRPLQPFKLRVCFLQWESGKFVLDLSRTFTTQRWRRRSLRFESWRRKNSTLPGENVEKLGGKVRGEAVERWDATTTTDLLCLLL